PACRAELEVLYQRIAALKALPVRRPARDRWPAVRDTLRVEQRRQRRRWGAWSLSAAAGIALLLLIRPGPAGRVDAAELERVKQQSATPEAELERYDPDQRVTSGRTAAPADAAYPATPTRAPRLRLLDERPPWPDRRGPEQQARLADRQDWREAGGRDPGRAGREGGPEGRGHHHQVQRHVARGRPGGRRGRVR